MPRPSSPSRSPWDLLVGLLRGDVRRWPVDESGDFRAEFLELTDYHGVFSLVHARVGGLGPEDAWPAALREVIRDRAIAEALWELRHRTALRQVLQALAEAGVRPLVFKGTLLACTLYPEEVTRSRGDTDLLVSREDMPVVRTVLGRLGFTEGAGLRGEYVSHQVPLTRCDADGFEHTLDVHWRINNSPVLAALFDETALRARARPVPALGPHAIGTGFVDALLIACVHRVTHEQAPYYVAGKAHLGGNRLIWLYDIHMLLGALTAAEVDELVREAGRRGMRGACLDGLARAQEAFGTVLPRSVTEGLAAGGPEELVTRYQRRGEVGRWWLDLKALGSLRAQAALVRETLLPGAEYVRWRYPDDAGAPLAWLHARRVANGLLARVRAARSGSGA